MPQRTFKVVDDACEVCHHKDECKITGISRDDVYQSLHNAKLYSFVTCADANIYEGDIFREVKEEV